jgi:hypothetical protein
MMKTAPCIHFGVRVVSGMDSMTVIPKARMMDYIQEATQVMLSRYPSDPDEPKDFKDVSLVVSEDLGAS